METEPSKVQILEQLQKIVSSDEFAASPRKREFLSYIVEKTLDGEASNLKGYAIGVDVFNRGEQFDPQADTIVRVQARNLRRALDLYYLTTGQNDAVKIEMPKGNYVPKFSLNQSKEPVESLENIKPNLESKPNNDRIRSRWGWKEWLLILALIVAVIALFT